MNKVYIILLILICVLTTGIINAADYYVSPNGSDNNSGTFEAPFQTIQHAADLIQCGDICYLREGIYHEEIEIINLHCTLSDPITFTNYQDEPVILDGTIPITSAWTVHDGNIYKTTIDFDIWQLFEENRMLISARWPNANLEDNSLWNDEEFWGHGGPLDQNGLQYDDPHDGLSLAALNMDLTGAMAVLNVGNWKSWTRVVQNHAAGQDYFNYEPVEGNGYKDNWPKHRYMLECHLDLLDQPNEWFYDPATGELYVWLEGGVTPSGVDIRGKVQSYAMQIVNSSHVIVENLGFFGTTLKTESSHNITLQNSQLLYPSYSRRMLGESDDTDITAFINSASEIAGNRITRCEIAYTDGPAIQMKGTDNIIEDNLIHHIDYSCSNYSNNSFSIHTISAPGMTFRRNTVHTTGNASTYRSGSYSDGHPILVELNHFYNCGLMQSDGANIQIGANSRNGSVVRYNWLHDTQKYCIRFDGKFEHGEGGYSTNGLIHHNVTWNTTNLGLRIKGDYHQTYNNSCFSSSYPDIVIRGIGGGMQHANTRNNAATCISGAKFDEDEPIPGIYEYNWNGCDSGGLELQDQLTDPDNFDFFPQTGSDLINAGVFIDGITEEIPDGTPDIGAYEHGGENWVPGVTWDVNSDPVDVDEQRNTETLPKAFHLQQNYPNPFNSRTQIRFNLNHPQQIRLSVHSITGQLINTILNKFMVDGHYIIEWNPVEISTGIYFIRLESENGVQVKKCLLLK